MGLIILGLFTLCVSNPDSFYGPMLPFLPGLYKPH